MPRGNPLNVALGPGILKVAALGSTIPTGIDDTWAVAWTDLGYSHDGHQFTYAPAYEDVEVAEELDPIDSIATGRQISVSFQLAELTAKNLKTALNGGTITFVAAGGGVTRAHTKFEPPDMGVELFVMLGFESEDTLERIIWRQCKQVGSIEASRRKGADKAGISCEFRVFKPATGLKPFVRYSGRGSDASA